MAGGPEDHFTDSHELYALVFVADQTHLVQRPPGGFVELLVLVGLARAERAGIAAAHLITMSAACTTSSASGLGKLLRDVDPEPA